MSKEMRVASFVFVFFVFFGPKIGRFIDTSIIASILLISFVAIKHERKIQIDSYTKQLVLLLFLILLYTLGVSFLNLYFDITFYGRTIRSLFSIVSISLYIRDNQKVDIDELNGILIAVLLIHAIIVLVSATVFVDLQYMIRWFNGYNKTVRAYRSTGLMMGFDMSGLLCNLGLVLTLCRKHLNIIYLILFSAATLFTSRFSILFLVVVMAIYVFIGSRNSKSSWKKIVLFSIGVLIAIFGITLLVITTKSFSSTQSYFANQFPIIYKAAYKVNRAYNMNEELDLSESKHFAINEDGFLAAFGTGIYGGADPGYTRFINCIGFVGLFLVILWHFYAIKQSLIYKVSDKRLRYNRIFIVMSIVMVLLGLNFKNSYFFTGTFFEFMLFQLYMFRFNLNYR